jgi:hypothetical protein
MAFDNFTIHHYRVLTDTPDGHRPGAIIELTEDAGNILASVGCVERLPDDATLQKGTYKRRDLTAEKR